MRPSWASLRIVLIYAAVAALWILTSDYLLFLVAPDIRIFHFMETIKGWIFVLATAGLLYLLIQRSLRGHERAERILRDTIESMVDAVLVVDRHYRVVDSNSAALNLLGLSAREEILRPLAEVVHLIDARDRSGRSLKLADFPIHQALRGNVQQGVDAKVKRHDGLELDIIVSASPIQKAPSGEVESVVTVLRDVSSLKQLQRLRDEFLTMASHELKTPVTIIKANAQILKRQQFTSSDGRGPAILDSIDRQCNRIDRLVRELLEVSRLELGYFDLRRQVINLGELIEEVVDRMRPVASPRHTLVFVCHGEVWVDADRDRIEQVLLNLLDNAIKYSPSGGEVRADLELKGTDAVFSIEDRGIGIPKERQDGVFTRYFRAHAGTSLDYYGGMGIGLSLNREIIDRHGGKMWFRSEEGRGSTFYFSLPLVLSETRE